MRLVISRLEGGSGSPGAVEHGHSTEGWLACDKKTRHNNITDTVLIKGVRKTYSPQQSFGRALGTRTSLQVVAV